MARQKVVSDEKEEEKKRRRKGALSPDSLSTKGSIFDLRCPFRALSAEFQMLQWMEHIRKRAS